MRFLKTSLIIISISLILVVLALFGFSLFSPEGEVAIEEGRIESVFKNLFPFGKSDDTNNLILDTDSATDDVILEGDQIVPKLRRVSNTAVAAAVTFERDEEVVIRFIERETGHIFDTTTTSLPQIRVSNTTIPRIQEVLWMPDGESLILRYIDEDSGENIESFYAEITSIEDVEEQSLIGVFLKRNIHAITLSQSGKQIFYLSGVTGDTVGTVANPNGKQGSRVFFSPLSEWILQWTSGNTIAFTTKPSAATLGYLYFFNKNSRVFEKVISGKNGLTTLVSPDKQFSLYSENIRNSITFGVLDISAKEETILPVTTLPEKCVWSINDEYVVYCAVPESIVGREYPDRWYQGLISFSDSIWKINIKTGSADMITEPESEVGLKMDIVTMMLTKDEKYLLFTNKKDSTLWSLRLGEMIPTSSN